MQNVDEGGSSTAGVYLYGAAVPVISATAFLAPTAVIIGDVEIGDGSGVWFGAVLRGDVCPIRVGRGSNIQDGVIIHGDEGGLVSIADEVTIGHGAIVHGCAIGEGALIGMGAIVLDGAVVGAGALIGAGAVVVQGAQVDPGSLWVGCPARKIRDLAPGMEGELRASAQHYRHEAQRYRTGHFRRAASAHQLQIREE